MLKTLKLIIIEIPVITCVIALLIGMVSVIIGVIAVNDNLFFTGMVLWVGSVFCLFVIAILESLIFPKERIPAAATTIPLYPPTGLRDTRAE